MRASSAVGDVAPDTRELRPAMVSGQWRARIVDVEGEEWQSLLSQADHMLFHEAAWARVTRRGFNAEPCAVLFERDGVVASGVLGFSFWSLWAKLLYFNFPYGGVVGKAPDGTELGRLFRQVAGELGAARVRVTDCPEIAPVAPDGFDRVETRTHILDLSCGDYESLWKGFKSRVRRDVRKSERSGVTVEEASTRGGVSVFYDLYLESMKRNKAIPKYSIALVEAMYDELAPLGRCAILIARHDGEAIAGVLVVDSATMSHYLMGGSNTDGLQYCPNDLLLHVAIRRAVERGLRGFDFLPSGVDDPALERFKSKWGAEPLSTDVFSMVTQPARMFAWDSAYRLAESRLGSLVLGALRGRRSR